MSKKDKGRISGRFTPMLWSTIESPAWRESCPTGPSVFTWLSRSVRRVATRHISLLVSQRVN